MKGKILTESDKNKIISENEKLIIENFAKVFNKIKRVDESEVNEAKIEEDLKSKLKGAALGAAALAGGASAQAQQSHGPNQGNDNAKELQYKKISGDDSKIADPFNVNKSANQNTGEKQLINHTKPIVDVQPGVTDGRTGQPSIYLYHIPREQITRDNVATERTTVFTKNLDMLRDMKEYRDYMARLKAAGKRGGYVSLDAPTEKQPSSTAIAGDIDENEDFETRFEKYKNGEHYLDGVRVYPEVKAYTNGFGATLNNKMYKMLPTDNPYIFNLKKRQGGISY